MRAAIHTRLERVMHDGNLSVADLARWFDRPDPTVRGWVRGGRVGGAQLDSAMIEAELAGLELRIKKRRGFPVPPLTPTNRIDYLTKLRNGK